MAIAEPTLQDEATPNPPLRSAHAPEWQQWLKPLASLKLSVVLFALGIFLVLAGTLAQVKLDIFEVMHRYFRCFFTWIDLQVFFPKTWFPNLQNIPGGFWFPGGWTIGGLMTLNLLSAHAIRFKVQAKGERLLWGIITTLIGIGVTVGVIEFGMSRATVYETSGLDWSWQWNLVRFGLLVPAIGCGIAASRYASDKNQRAEFITYASLSLLSLAVAAFLIAGGESVRLNNSAMRILWQLIQATVAGGILLGGCLLLFKKRAGIVLLHAGVLLLMANEVVVYSLHEEANMVIFEGETVDFTQDIRTSELAIIDRSPEEHDQQTVIPRQLLIDSADDKTIITDPQLPFQIRVLEFYKNSNLKPRAEADKNPADFGTGLARTLVEVAPSVGTDSQADYPAAYIELLDPESGEPLHKLAVSAVLQSGDKVTVDGKEYEVDLRFKRTYKPYSVHLIDVRKDDYIGTRTPMNYSSDIRLVDKSQSEDRKVRIWMNNPLRYSGETLYQSGYNKLGDQEVTTLQVVTNEGWMIPYVACMIVAIGMLYQFAVTLFRFLNRVSSGRIDLSEESSSTGGGLSVTLVPALVLGLIGGYWLFSLTKAPEPKAGEFNFYEFGKIPVVYDGRSKPIDTLARNMFRVSSNRETVRIEKSKDEDGNETPAYTLPATQVFLELITSTPVAFDRPIIRIVNDELLSTLELERRKSHRYSINELTPHLGDLQKVVDEARQVNEEAPERLSLYQRKALDLHRRVGRVDLMMLAFIAPQIDMTGERVTEQFMAALAQTNRLDERDPPLLIPPTADSKGPDDENLARDEWETFAKAFLRDLIYPVAFKAEANPFSGKFLQIISAFQEDDPVLFNKRVREYQTLLKENKVDRINPELIAYESRFNNFSPFFYAAFLYIFAFVVVSISWLVPKLVTPANYAAVGLVLVTFLVHSWALYARIAISGRPPVTNLYSSAVFIGWAGVLAGILIEFVFKRGIGNTLAAVSGFASLWIAHGLAGDGDTFTVLQAVLDTQFWLSTHVVCITLGYAATFVAGLLGVISICHRNPLALASVSLAVLSAYLIQQSTEGGAALFAAAPFFFAIPVAIMPMMFMTGAAQRKISPKLEKDLSRMIYGTLCFALWFSFVGTVLGGLWADDSWGRFWGWDPKENGALIIVLWNALVLHAFWDKQVRERGLALLAVAGNITTTWSWFGVNELGVGLHTYGFTEGVLWNLFLFVSSQLALIVIGAWGSSEPVKGATVEAAASGETGTA